MVAPLVSTIPASATPARSGVWRRRLTLCAAAAVLGALPARLAANEMSGGLRAATGALLATPLTAPARTLRVATLDLPRPIGTMAASAPAHLPAPPADAGEQDRQAPAPLVVTPAPSDTTAAVDARATSAGQLDPQLELALDMLLELPVIQDKESQDRVMQDRVMQDGGSRTSAMAGGEAPDGPADLGSGIGPDLDGMEAAEMAADGLTAPDTAEAATASLAPEGASVAHEAGAVRHDAVTVFGRDPHLFPPLTFQYDTLADRGFVPQPLQPPAPPPQLLPASAETHSPPPDGIWPSPAERLNLNGPTLARAQKCLAEAIYYESRGEPKRGQIAVAQVVVNRVFSGYYPADVCGTVYQNAHRHLACQFTFACDDVKDVIREPDMWVQAKEIAADMLDGKLWLTSVGRATHYHAYWVHPRWVREMNRLDRIGVHTFYRPRNWQS